MPELVSLETISLKNNQQIKEDIIQSFIYEKPYVLGLGNLTQIRREKKQPSGGRLDILLGDEDNSIRYEVEVQLGATDPSHIIRTIEYWDSERKRYPQYDHCAVIVAEEITGRFFNVISLFNGAIPLIALQMKAVKYGDNIALSFTKVIDRIDAAKDDEEQEQPTDREYWEKRTSTKIMSEIDKIFKSLGDIVSGFSLKYNKGYIGLLKDGISRNFLWFSPKKAFIKIGLKIEESSTIIQELENEGLDITYNPKWKELKLKINDFETYNKHKTIIDKVILESKEFFNLTD